MSALDQSNLHSKKFIYTQCNVCGISCSGPKVNQKAQPNTLDSIFFDYSWRGVISLDSGLTLMTPESTKYTNINEKGTYEIIFRDKGDPHIRMKRHDCLVTLDQEKVRECLGYIVPSGNGDTFKYEAPDGTVAEYSNDKKLTINWHGKLINIEVYEIGIFINGQQYAADSGIYKIDFFPPPPKCELLPHNHKFVLTKI